MFYVYHHIRKDTNEVFYVGKGKEGRAFSKSNRNKHWHNINNKCGFTIDIISEGLSEDEAFDLEKQEIARLSESGCELVNLTEGGEGVSGHKHSPDAIEKMRLAKLGKPNLALKGKPKSPEHVEKMAQSKRGKPNPCTPEKAAAISEAKKGKPLSDKHVEALKNRWEDPIRREKHREAMKAHWQKRKAQE